MVEIFVLDGSYLEALMSKLSVAIADDNERILRLLGEIVSDDEELQVVGTAKDGEEAYKMIKEKDARNCVLLIFRSAKQIISSVFFLR